MLHCVTFWQLAYWRTNNAPISVIFVHCVNTLHNPACPEYCKMFSDVVIYFQVGSQHDMIVNVWDWKNNIKASLYSDWNCHPSIHRDLLFWNYSCWDGSWWFMILTFFVITEADIWIFNRLMFKPRRELNFMNPSSDPYFVNLWVYIFMKNNEIPVPYPNDKKCPLNFVNYKNDISIITTIHKLYTHG